MFFFQRLARLTRSKLSKPTLCNCWPIYYSFLLTNSAPHLDWGWLIMGLDFLSLTLSLMQVLLTLLSCLPTKQHLFQVRCSQYATFDSLPFQFTICLSATSDAFLTSLQFFQLLRQNGTPWISLYMDPIPRPGKENGLFRLTVLWLPDSYLRCKDLN